MTAGLKKAVSNHLLIAGFSLILVLMVVVLLIGLNGMRQTNASLKRIVHENNLKVEYATIMRFAARERTLTLHAMAIMTDLFALDERYAHFTSMGAKFARARMSLLDMRLNDQEREILAKQGHLTGIAVPLQERVVDLVMANEISAANALLLDEAIPAQNDVLTHLNHLVEYQQNAAQRAVALANETYRSSYDYMAVLGGLAVLLGILIALYVARRMGQGVRELRATANALHQTVRELEFQKFALDQHAIVSIADSNGLISYVNDKFCEVSQHAREELLGKDHRIVSSGYHTGKFFDDLWTTINRGDVWRGEIKNRRKDGTCYWVDTSIIPFLDGQGRPFQFVSIRTDITEQKQAEAELRAYQERLEEKVEDRTQDLWRLNKELESFSYSVSHDLRAPLRNISGFSQALLEDFGEYVPQEGKEYLDRILLATRRMSRLIDALLVLSRVTRRELNTGRVDVSKLVAMIVKDLRQASPERQVRVEVQDGMLAIGDENLIGILFENLVGNAWKYTVRQPDAKIEIGMQYNSDVPVYYVKDNGAGFNMKYVDRLFTPFQRLHSKDEFEGTGIGLATVQRIVERHGGRVWATGKQGEGAMFQFFLNPGERPDAR
jgi:PAS domain S-box-containing protein